MARKKIRRTITRFLAGVAAAVAFNLIQLLPYRCVTALASLVARLIFLGPASRRMVLANLAVAFPDWDDDQRRVVAKRSLRNVCHTFLEFIWLMRRPQRIFDLVQFPDEQMSKLKDALSDDVGAIFISPHLGSWELGNLAINAHGVHTTSVYAKIGSTYVERTVLRCRTQFGAKFISERGAAKTTMRSLRDRCNIGLMIDQNTRPRLGGIFVDFFSLPVPASRAPAMFARKVNAPVIMGCCVRDEQGRLHCEIATLRKAAADYESDEALTRDINRQTEAWIRQYPDQYLWLYRRWRYIPQDCDADTQARYPFYSKTIE